MIAGVPMDPSAEMVRFAGTINRATMYAEISDLASMKKPRGFTSRSIGRRRRGNPATGSSVPFSGRRRITSGSRAFAHQRRGVGLLPLINCGGELRARCVWHRNAPFRNVAFCGALDRGLRRIGAGRIR